MMALALAFFSLISSSSFQVNSQRIPTAHSYGIVCLSSSKHWAATKFRTSLCLAWPNFMASSFVNFFSFTSTARFFNALQMRASGFSENFRSPRLEVGSSK